MAEFAVHSGAASMVQDNVLHNREAKACASGLTGASFIDSIKAFK